MTLLNSWDAPVGITCKHLKMTKPPAVLPALPQHPSTSEVTPKMTSGPVDQGRGRAPKSNTQGPETTCPTQNYWWLWACPSNRCPAFSPQVKLPFRKGSFTLDTLLSNSPNLLHAPEPNRATVSTSPFSSFRTRPSAVPVNITSVYKASKKGKGHPGLS